MKFPSQFQTAFSWDFLERSYTGHLEESRCKSQTILKSGIKRMRKNLTYNISYDFFKALVIKVVSH